jgi:hypothetical protein
MPLTKTHFEAIASIVKREVDYARTLQERAGAANTVAANGGKYRAVAAGDIATDLADYFATQNPQFSRERFLSACGVEAGK